MNNPKIVGKIDLSKFNKPKNKERVEVPIFEYFFVNGRWVREFSHYEKIKTTL